MREWRGGKGFRGRPVIDRPPVPTPSQRHAGAARGDTLDLRACRNALRCHSFRLPVFCADPTECRVSPGNRLMRMDRAFFAIPLAETTPNTGRFQHGCEALRPQGGASRQGNHAHRIARPRSPAPVKAFSRPHRGDSRRLDPRKPGDENFSRNFLSIVLNDENTLHFPCGIGCFDIGFRIRTRRNKTVTCRFIRVAPRGAGRGSL